MKLGLSGEINQTDFATDMVGYLMFLKDRRHLITNKEHPKLIYSHLLGMGFP